MLDRSFMQDVTKTVRDMVEQTVEGFKKPAVQQAPDEILSSRAQLERFMLMQPEHLKQLRDTHGDAEFTRYISRMRDLAKQVK